jgi:hypothetical protein
VGSPDVGHSRELRRSKLSTTGVIARLRSAHHAEAWDRTSSSTTTSSSKRCCGKITSGPRGVMSVNGDSNICVGGSTSPLSDGLGVVGGALLPASVRVAVPLRRPGTGGPVR